MMVRSLSTKAFFGAAIGAIVEYYDFALFTVFLPIIAPLFFPADSVYHSLVKGYFVLLIGTIARPLGGIFFGYFGDKFGRRKALLGSICGIVLGTMVMGLIPTYATLGVWASIIIIIAKSVQLFCFGGEYSGAGIFIVEHAQNKNEALVGCLFTATAFVGAFMASLAGIAVTFQFMPEDSWRIAFILGAVFGIVGIGYRKKLLESPEFRRTDTSHHSLTGMIKKYPKELLAGFFIGGFAASPVITILTFINPVLMTKGYITTHQLMLIQTFLIFVAVMTFVPAGIIADKISPKKVMRGCCVAFVIFSYPLLYFVDRGNFVISIFVFTLFVIMTESFHGPSHAYLKKIFLMQYRYRATSLGFGLGASVLGGLTPLIDNYFYQLTGQFSSSSLWLIFISIGTLTSMHSVEKKQRLNVEWTPASITSNF